MGNGKMKKIKSRKTRRNACGENPERKRKGVFGNEEMT